MLFIVLGREEVLGRGGPVRKHVGSDQLRLLFLELRPSSSSGSQEMLPEQPEVHSSTPGLYVCA